MVPWEPQRTRFRCSAPPWDAGCSWFHRTTLPLTPEIFQQQPRAKDHSHICRRPKSSAPDVLCRLVPPFGETLRFYTADSSSKRAVLEKSEAEADLAHRVRPCKVSHAPGSTKPVETSSAAGATDPQHCVPPGVPRGWPPLRHD